MKKRWLLVGAVIALIFLGTGALGYYLYVQGKGRDIRGSSTVEFVPTEPPPTPRAEPPSRRTGARRPPSLTRVDWPTFGYDARRLRYLPSPLAPPFRVQWTFRAHHLIEFPPAVAYGRVYIANNPGTLFAVSAKTGRLGWRFASGRCTAASPAVADGVVYEAFLNKAPCKPQAGDDGHRRRGGRARRAQREAVLWRHRIGPSETSPLVADGRVYVGDWNGWVYALDAEDRAGGLALPDRRRGEGRARALRPAALRRLVRPPPVRAGRAHRPADLARLVAGAPRRARARSTRRRRPRTDACTSARPTARSTRSARRPASCAGRSPPAATSTARRRSGSRRILVGSYSGRFFSLDAATGDVQWQFDGERPDLRLGDRARERRLLLDAEGPYVRARPAHRAAALELPRRQVLAARRRPRARVPDRVHEAVRAALPTGVR